MIPYIVLKKKHFFIIYAWQNRKKVVLCILLHWKGVQLSMEYQVEQVISELSKIDNASESIITSTDVEKTNYAKEIDEKTILFEKNLEEDMRISLEEYRNKLGQDNDKILKQMRTNTEKDLEKIDSAYNKNHAELAKEIFNKLIKA